MPTPINQQQIGGAGYHAACFKCVECKAALSAGFMNHESGPHCQPCFLAKEDPYRRAIPSGNHKVHECIVAVDAFAVSFLIRLYD
jgi:hypothetical protein